MNNNIQSAPNLVFESERLRFKPLGEEDLSLSIKLWTDPEVTQYVSGPTSEAELVKNHSKYMQRCAGGAIGVWTLTTLERREKIGTAILLPMPVELDDTDWDLVAGDGLPDGDIEVGYILKKSAWGKGYATEACARMIEFGFENTSLREIVASIDEDNHASEKVLLKSGLKPMGKQLSYGEQCPFFRITREKWLERKIG
ncbi:MAG: GNAT family N-acetyltransferase [Rhizobiaceae bacterium]